MNKIWTYVISRELSPEQLNQLQALGLAFVKEWTAHENKLQADFVIYKNRILVISVDEAVHSASGCSIDKLLRFMKDQEKQFSVELLNRLLVAYESDNLVQVTAASKIPELLVSGQINSQTPVFDTAVATGEQFAEWKKPLGNTWLKKYLS